MAIYLNRILINSDVVALESVEEILKKIIYCKSFLVRQLVVE